MRQGYIKQGIVASSDVEKALSEARKIEDAIDSLDDFLSCYGDLEEQTPSEYRERSKLLESTKLLVCGTEIASIMSLLRCYCAELAKRLDAAYRELAIAEVK